MKPTVTAIVIGWVLPLSCACGEKPARLGVAVDTLHIAKTNIGPSPPDAASHAFEAPGSFARARRVRFIEDNADEQLVALPDHHAVEVRDASGHAMAQFRTEDYLTGFDVAAEQESGRRLLVLYTYPNSDHGGTFQVLDANHQEVARWNISPPPGAFATGSWPEKPGKAAIFFFTDVGITVRDVRGNELAHLEAPEARTFRDIHVAALRDNLLAVAGAGNGYTPYHMVAVYGPGGRLLYDEIGDEHAFDLKPQDDKSFVVVTRSTLWRYEVPSSR